MQKISELAKANNFSHTTVTREEYADGIGAVAGDNYVKDQVFYTTAQMINLLGHELKHTSGKFQASSQADAEKQIVSQLQNAGVVAYQIGKSNEYKRGEWFVKVMYVK